jgi:hypothetical protein
MKGLALCLGLAACASPRSEPARRHQDAEAMRRHQTKRPPARGPVLTTPKQLFDDFTSPDTEGLALLDKYRDGATFTAIIKTVGAEEDGKPVVWIDVDGENLMTLDFDDPVPRELHVGAQLTVTCKIGGASGALMMVTSCSGG